MSHPRRLRILAGPSIDSLTPIKPNSDTPLKVSSDVFEGKIVVYIKGFGESMGVGGEKGGDKESSGGSDSAYFEEEGRSGVTWSFQVQGKFLHEISANDVLFGNVFDHPLRLPFGFNAALAFMQYIDPTLEQDLSSQTKPWALSPLIATMPYFEHTRVDELHKVPPFPPLKPVGDRTVELRSSDGIVNELIEREGTNRRAFFKNSENRKKVIFGPQDLITTDFAYGYLEFSSEGVSLGIPGGLSFDMMKYWDGQPVRFVCCQRGTGENTEGVPWGKVFWVISIEAIEE